MKFGPGRNSLSCDSVFRLIQRSLLAAGLLAWGGTGESAPPRPPILALVRMMGTEPNNVVIDSPAQPCVVTAGTRVEFSGSSDGGKSPKWLLNGPGITNLGIGTGSIMVAYTFTNPGTYVVTYSVGPDTVFRGGSASCTVQVNGATPKPAIATFSASPSSLTYGSATTLSWTQTGATSLSLNTGDPVASTASSIVLRPLATTTYVLSATNSAGTTQSPPLTVNVSSVTLSSLSPQNATVIAGSQVSFSASVTGAADPGIAWSVGGGGTIDSFGRFSALTAGTYTVTATSTADVTKKASTTVTVNSIVTGVTLDPPSVSLLAGGTQVFSAQANGLGGNNSTVTWSCTEGAISSNGTYTAPVAGGTYEVVARSVQDPSKAASAAVTVRPVSVSAISPANTSVVLGTSVQFSATVANAAKAGVGWSADNGGSIDGTGLFLASSEGTFTVTATSVLDPTKWTRTTVTVIRAVGSASMAVISAPAAAMSVAVNNPVAFAATSTADASVYLNYNVTATSWTFGDGAAASGATTSHAFATPGTYTVTLTVTYQFDQCKVRTPDGGCNAYQSRTGTATSTRSIRVLVPPIINAFTATPSTSMAGRPVVLSWTVANATSLALQGVDLGSEPSATVTPFSNTTYTLTAKNEVATATATATITTYVVAVTLNTPTAALALGETRLFTATVSPANQGVTWSTSGGSINNGSFTGTAPGTYSVTATSLEDPSKSASATVTVSAAAVSAVTPSNPSFFAGTPFQFNAKVNGAVDQGVTWSVEGGATISPSGLFKAATVGSYTVRATSTADPTRTSTTTATVKSAVTEIALTPASTTLAMGATLAFGVQVGVLTGDSTAVVWSCVGGTITGTGYFTAPLAEGVCTVQATSVQDPSKVATASVLVQKLGITLSPQGKTIRVGKMIQFLSTVSGEANTKVNWSASGPGASITSNGLFTASAEGTCTVTASSDADPNLTISTTVIVKTASLVPEWKRDIVYLGGQEVGEVDASGKVHTTLTDHLGTPRIVVGSDGVVELEQKYLPFGQLLWQVGSLTTAKGYTNHEQTDPSGLIYMQARFYLPMYGRFASPDPARDQHFEDTQSWNIYSYCGNNPVMRLDPDGMADREAGYYWGLFYGYVRANSGNLIDHAISPSSISRGPGFNAGERDGTTAAIAQAGAETGAGLTATTVGGGAALAGAPVAGVGAVPGVVVAGAGLLMTTHGAMVGTTGLANLGAGPSGQEGGGKPGSENSVQLESNPKHHPNSASPEPKNAAELFKGSVEAKNGTRWVKDKNGVVHRYSAPSNGKTHWNGSTGGKDPIKPGEIPKEIRKELRIRG